MCTAIHPRLGLLFALTLSISAPVTVFADCSITGTSAGEWNTEYPDLGSWKYTIVITWDTGTVYALSHVDIQMDYSGNCTCEEFAAVLQWLDPVGYSDGEPQGCSVDYEAYLECDGDPSIPGIEVPLLKFEPYELGDCEPGPTGTATFYLYSDLAPAPIMEENLFLVDKHGQLACTGLLTGQFPGLPCDPTAKKRESWGGMKQTYQR
jgi:hypothetical protein